MSKPGRNDLCSCGSGKKFKRCCESKTSARKSSRLLMIAVGGAMLAAIAAGIASFTSEPQGSVRVWDPVHGHYHNASGQQVPETIVGRRKAAPTYVLGVCGGRLLAALRTSFAVRRGRL
jgi:hypothetical protein